MSTLSKLECDGYVTHTGAYLIRDTGLWHALVLCTEDMREWDGGISRTLVESRILDALSYVSVKVTGRKVRWLDYRMSAVTVRVDNGEEVYRAQVAVPRYSTLAQVRDLLENYQPLPRA